MHKIPGYSHASKQPLCVISINIPDDLSFDYQLVDDFLLHGFLLKYLSFDATHGHIDAICERISFLANSLLQAIKLPTFELAKIAASQYNPDTRLHRVHLLVPTVSNIPQDIILHAHGFALKILTELHPKYDFEAAFETIQVDFIKKFRGFIPGGISTVSVLYAAAKHKVPFTHLGSGIYQLGWGCRARRFDRSTNDKDASLGNKIASDKRLTNQLLNQAGFPVPRQISVSSLKSALRAGQELGYPVVLKPAKLERGEGVTIGIGSDDELKRAYLKKNEELGSLLLEEQVSGLCHRIFVAGQKAWYVSARHPMHVLGDGVHTIRELAQIENGAQLKHAKHWRRPKLEINETSLELVAQLNLTADSIPPNGMRVPFQKIAIAELGGMSEDVFRITHPDNLALAEKLAEFCGLDCIGIDIISDDISISWRKNNAKINEVNFAPELKLFHSWVQRSLSSYIPEIFPEHGRIPIHMFSGGPKALHEARRFQEDLFKEGKPHFLCCRDMTQSPDGTRYMDSLRADLFLRAQALLLNKAVEGIIYVLQDESVLMTGFPFDGVASKVTVDDQFISTITGACLEHSVRNQISNMISHLPVFDQIA